MMGMVSPRVTTTTITITMQVIVNMLIGVMSNALEKVRT